MRRIMLAIMAPLAMVLLAAPAGAAGPPAGPLKRCPADSIVSGPGCMDKYEASVWRVPNPTTTNRVLVARIQQGTATAADLANGGATHLGVQSTQDYLPCGDQGQDCGNIYAVSLPGVVPSSNITWFQAQQACRNAGKRLPSNAEWQAAVAGTPDPDDHFGNADNGVTDCNIFGIGGPTVPSGSRSGCVSARGAFDMVGNLEEWVADWVPQSTMCPNWGSFSNDGMCLAGASATDNSPGALTRGGSFILGTNAGPLTVLGG